MKALLRSLAAIAFSAGLLLATGCGGAKTVIKNEPGTLSSGNWLLMPRSSANVLATDGHLRGVAAVSASSVLMNMQMTANGNDSGICVPQTAPITLAGADNAGALKLAWQSGSTAEPESLAITATVNADNSVLGAYTVTGSCKDAGTIFGVQVPLITGTWSGAPLATNLGTGVAEPITMTAGLTQAAQPSSSNLGPAQALPLSGTVTVTSASCTASAPVVLTLDNTQSYITGEQVAIVALSADGVTQLNWYAVLRDPSTARAMIAQGFSGSNPSLSSDTCFMNFGAAAELDMK